VIVLSQDDKLWAREISLEREDGSEFTVGGYLS
jgi:hypothetical protein